jgi:hypothetical protein
MRKVYTRGIDLANKKMLMAATAYNLKKIMKYSVKKRASQANAKAIEAKNNLKNSFEILF